EGGPEDWDTILRRVEQFSIFGLDRWVAKLIPLLKQFSKASRGDVHQKFWQSMYKREMRSGGPHISGWINRFMPYLLDWQTELPTRLNPYVFERWSMDLIYDGGVKTSAIPNGLCTAPVIWESFVKRQLHFTAGFVGITQESVAVRPEIGWVIS